VSNPNAAGLKRKVGLDKPCRLCGQPIYFGYQGPIEGICGRCADRKLRAHRGKGATRTLVVRRDRRRRGLLAALLLAFLAGAAAMYLAGPYLPF